VRGQRETGWGSGVREGCAAGGDRGPEGVGPSTTTCSAALPQATYRARPPSRPAATVVYSAAPITGPTLAAAMGAMPGAGFLNLYGQTEVISTGLPREFHRADGDERSRRRLRSVGLPFPGNEIRIAAEDGRQCPPGEAGEVCVRSVAMFRGYWNDSAATAEVLRDGWCHTGDIGTLDTGGLLYLVDRKSDVIISGEPPSLKGGPARPASSSASSRADGRIVVATDQPALGEWCGDG
jgi:acyl-coenzyme A synthetase/AMP-(fatty) acid ligase